jgi:hypothetical protein
MVPEICSLAYKRARSITTAGRAGGVSLRRQLGRTGPAYRLVTTACRPQLLRGIIP